LDNVALGIEEFAAKPGLRGKRAADLTDQDLIDELERDGFFARLYRVPPAHGE
jgi:hypothetical protein